jgi:hypothetical protein
MRGMANAATQPVSMPDETLHNVEIFCGGLQKGIDWTDSDLDDAVANFHRWSVDPNQKGPHLRVSLACGHDEDQKFLEDSGLAAFGWIRSLARVGDKLVSTISNIPYQVASLIRGGRFTRISAEMYRPGHPPPGIPAQGAMLRRVALQGSDVPHCKNLSELTALSSFTEDRLPWRPTLLVPSALPPLLLPGGTFCLFSEVKVMDRKAMKDALSKHGMDTKCFDEQPDDTAETSMSECLRCFEGKDEAHRKEMDGRDNEEWPAPKDDTQKAVYRERAMKLKEKADRYHEKYCALAKPDTKEAVLMSETVQTQLSAADVSALVAKGIADALPAALAGATAGPIKALADAKDSAQKFAEEQHRATTQTIQAERKRGVDALVERLSREGRIPPAEVEAERRGLMLLDAGVVNKFSEGGKEVERTAFDDRVHQLQGRRSLFAEQFRDPAGAATATDAEVAKVEQHFMAHSESFKGVSTKETIVEGFKAARKHDPTLTASEFLGT